MINIDAAKHASDRSITAVCPFLGYARQDRKSDGREPSTARPAIANHIPLFTNTETVRLLLKCIG